MLILSKQLELKLAHLSTKPGVYQFKDKSGGIIYIGKAKSLRNRVRSYFQQSRKVDAKLSRLVSRIHDLEVIVTDSEVEALILEANLVKEHKPRYNINLKDDKSFPYIRVTNERFPRIFPTRKIIRDGSQYFGPYTDVQSMRMLLKTIKRIFAVRTCNYDLVQEKIDQGKFKLCLNYHIKRCYGPCEGLIDEKEYNNVIAYVINFIKGHTKQIEHDIRDHIAELAAQLRFEEAARLRDQLNFIEIFQQKQKVVDQSLTDRDLLAVSTEADDSCCVVFKIRDGRIIARQHYYLNGVQDETKEAVVAAFLKQYYLKNEEIPGEVMLPVEIGDEIKTINTWLLQKRNAEIKFSHPVRGAKAHLLKMCEKNAKLLLDELKLEKMQSPDYITNSVKALQNDLKLEHPPKRIEGFDISNIQGTNPVASMVCFVNGVAKKSEYRRFKIQSKQTPDDFLMMKEAVFRRYSRLLRENKSLPDLILIDGGKGQLNAALQGLQEAGVENMPIAALAKRLDEIFVPGFSDPQNIKRGSAGLHLLQRIRDEAHRFAVTYHRALRKQRTLVSILEKIPGVGGKRRDLLLKHFGSVKKIKSAPMEEIEKVDGISSELAREIYLFFNPKQ